MPLQAHEKLEPHKIIGLRKVAVAFAAFVALTGGLVATGLAQSVVQANLQPACETEHTETKNAARLQGTGVPEPPLATIGN